MEGQGKGKKKDEVFAKMNSPNGRSWTILIIKLEVQIIVIIMKILRNIIKIE